MNNSFENSQAYTQEPRGDNLGNQQAFDQMQRSGLQPTSTGQNNNVGQDQGGFQPQQADRPYKSDYYAPTQGQVYAPQPNIQQQAYEPHKSDLDRNVPIGAGNVQQQAYDQHKSSLDSNVSTGASNVQQQDYDQHKANLDNNASTGVPQLTQGQLKSNTGANTATGTGVAQQAYDQHKSKLDFDSANNKNAQQTPYDQYTSELDTTIPSSGNTTSGEDLHNAQDQAYYQHKAKSDFDAPAADNNVQQKAYEQHKTNLDVKGQSDKIITDPEVVKTFAREEKIGGVIDKLVAKVENVLGLKDKAEVRQATGEAKVEHAKEIKLTGELNPADIPRKANFAVAHNAGQDVSQVYNTSNTTGNIAARNQNTARQVEREAYEQHKSDLDNQNTEDHLQKNAAAGGVSSQDKPTSRKVEQEAYQQHKSDFDRQDISDHFQKNADTDGQDIQNADRNTAEAALGANKDMRQFDETNPASYMPDTTQSNTRPNTTTAQVPYTESQQQSTMPGAF